MCISGLIQPCQAAGEPVYVSPVPGATSRNYVDSWKVKHPRKKRVKAKALQPAMTDAELESKLGTFDSSGKLSTAGGESAALHLSLDTFVAWDFHKATPYVGIGLIIPQPWPKLRLSVQGANDRLGVGVGWKIIPVIDLTLGLSVFHDFTCNASEVGAYVSIFKW
jgi:hypothetical protein